MNRLQTVMAVDNEACLAVLLRLGPTSLAHAYPRVFEVRVELATVPHPRAPGTIGPKREPLSHT